MNLFNFMNLFWQEDAKQPFSVSEAALYFLLLHEANTQRWKMPIVCNTTIICFKLKTTRQNIEKAREKLRNRGMISFEKGTGKDNPATYELLTPQFTGQLRDELRGQLRDELRDNNNHYNKKYNKDEKEKSERQPLIPIYEMKKILSEDKSWKEQVIQLFKKGRYSHRRILFSRKNRLISSFSETKKDRTKNAIRLQNAFYQLAQKINKK